MAIVGLDYGNITTVAISKEATIVIESRVSEATDINRLGQKEVFEFNGVEYVANSGHFENNQIKYKKDNFLSLVYYSIAKVTSSNSINLVTGIPAGQYNINKSEMIEFIKKNNSATVTIEGLTRNIIINNVVVVPEGYSLKTFPNIVNECKKGLKTIIVDIGGGTTDIAELDEQFNFIGGDSIKYGLLDLYRSARKYINNTYNLNVSLEESRKYFDGELELIDENISYKSEILKEFIKALINELRGVYHNLSNINIILTGGGAKNVYPTFKLIYPLTIKVDDIKASAQGNYTIGEVYKW